MEMGCWGEGRGGGGYRSTVQRGAPTSVYPKFNQCRLPKLTFTADCSDLDRKVKSGLRLCHRWLPWRLCLCAQSLFVFLQGHCNLLYAVAVATVLRS
jgi:hypothetical protein